MNSKKCWLCDLSQDVRGFDLVRAPTANPTLGNNGERANRDLCRAAMPQVVSLGARTQRTGQLYGQLGVGMSNCKAEAKFIAMYC